MQKPNFTIPSEGLVPVDNDHSAHANMFKTLNLLCIEPKHGATIYFIVEGCAEFGTLDEVRAHNQYYYDEHSCPTNYIPVEAIFWGNDDDPHGVFEYVDTVWMPHGYDGIDPNDERELFIKLFPRLDLTPPKDANGTDQDTDTGGSSGGNNP
jgi:hypothetical protein